MLLSYAMFLTEQFENGDAGLAGAVIIIGTILSNNFDELSDCRVKISGGKVLNCRVVQLSNVAVRELPGIMCEGVESGNHSDRIQQVYMLWLVQIPDRRGCLCGICENKTPGQKNACIDISRFEGEHFFEQNPCGLKVSCNEEYFGLLDLSPVFAGNSCLKPALDLIFREGANKFVCNHTINKQFDVWDALNVVLPSNFDMLFCVHLSEGPSAVALSGKPFKHGAQDLAGTAPVSPKIDENRSGITSFDNFFFEIGDIISHKFYLLFTNIPTETMLVL
ncbi:MAG: hypothetical protein HW389_1927 [Bacteroidetes bacterium]|nr:hypothetical protein [Bacteroidota bacterium]